jgi:hypothetical protein
MLQDFPEALVSALFVFSMLNLRLWDKKVLAVAVLQTLTNLVRLLPIAFGIHTVILIFSLAAYTRLLTGARLSRILIAVLLCIGILLAAESIYAVPLLNFTGLSYEEAFANPFLRAAFSLPYEIILLLLALGKNYYHRRNILVRSDSEGL